MNIGITATSENKEIKQILITHLTHHGFDVTDLSVGEDIFSQSCNMAEAVLNGKVEKGIVVDDYGSAPFMICTKYKGIVCAQVADEHSAKMTRDHNNTTIITLGTKVSGIELLKSICLTFAEMDYSGGRHQIRVDMLDAMN